MLWFGVHLDTLLNIQLSTFPLANLYMIDINRIRIGMSKSQIREMFGNPDLEGGSSKKYKEYNVWKFGEVELHFDVTKKNAKLFLVGIFNENLHQTLLN